MVGWEIFNIVFYVWFFKLIFGGFCLGGFFRFFFGVNLIDFLILFFCVVVFKKGFFVNLYEFYFKLFE